MGAAYVQAAKLFIPEIVRAGRSVGRRARNNEHKQLTFFEMDMDVDASNSEQLALCIQHCLLSDCSGPHEEAMLAVAWGEPVIRCSPSDASNIKRRLVEKGRI